MSAGAGTTTITQAASGATLRTARDLAIVWRFPHASRPVVALQWDGDGELVAGRDAACAVQLGGNDVSRRHAALRRGTDGTVTIADLGSRNGVRVNGRAVTAAPLAAEDVVRLGAWVGVVTATPGDVVEIAPGFWGGEALNGALAPLRQVAETDLPIVLEGETGAGKERVADALHRWSGR